MRKIYLHIILLAGLFLFSYPSLRAQICAGIDSVTMNVSTSVYNNGILQACEGGAIVLQNPSGALVNWTVAGRSYTNLSTLTLTDSLATGAYLVKIFEDSSSVALCRIEFMLVVNPRPSGISFVSPNGTVQNNALSVCVPATNVNIISSCPGGNCPSDASGYRWSNGVTTTSGQILNIASLPVTGAASSVYTLSVTNDFLCTSVQSLTVFKNYAPAVNISSPAVICSDNAITVSTAPTACMNCNNTGLSYIWSAAAPLNVSPGMTDVTAANLIATPINNTTANQTVTYRVTITNSLECTQTITSDVSVRAIWRGTFSVEPTTDVCHGSQITATLTSLQNYPFSRSFRLYDYADTSYRLTTPLLPSTTFSRTFIFTADTTHGDTTHGGYIFGGDVLMNGCLSELFGPGLQTVYPNPEIALTGDIVACAGGVITSTVASIVPSTLYYVTPSSISYAYQWSANNAPRPAVHERNFYYPPGTGNPAVTVSYNPVPELACRATDTYTATIASVATLTLTSSSATDEVCLGSPVTVSVASPANYELAYTWYVSSGGVTDTVNTGSSLVDMPTEETVYTVAARTLSGSCPAMASHTVGVNYPPSARIINPSPIACTDYTLTITGVVSGGSAITSTVWSGITGATGTGLTYNLPIGGAGTAVLTAVDAKGCTGTHSLAITRPACSSLELTRSLYKQKYCTDDAITLVAHPSTVLYPDPTYTWSYTAGVNNISFANGGATMIISPPLVDDNISLIVSDGDATFYIEGLVKGKPSNFLTLDNGTSDDPNHQDITKVNTREKIVFDPFGVITTTLTSITLNPAPAVVSTTGASQVTNGTHLDNTSIISIYVSSNDTDTVPTIEQIVFGGEYRGKIINRTTNYTIGGKSKTVFHVQVPCMLAESNTDIRLVTLSGTIAPTTNCIKVLPASKRETGADEVSFSGGKTLSIMPELADRGGVVALPLGTMPLTGTGFRDQFTYTTALKNYTVTSVTSATTVRMTINMVRTTPASTNQNLTISRIPTAMSVNGVAVSPPVATVTFGDGNAADRTRAIVLDYTLADFTSGPTITLSVDSGAESMREGLGAATITLDYIGANVTGNAEYQATRNANADYDPIGSPVNLVPVVPMSITGIDLFSSYTAPTGNPVSRALSTSAPTGGLGSGFTGACTTNVPSDITLTGASTITHTNSGRSVSPALSFPITTGTSACGVTNTVSGPSLITHITYSDFFWTWPQTTIVNDPNNGTATSLTLGSVALHNTNAPLLGQNTGHVCVFQRSITRTATFDRVYISENDGAIAGLSGASTSLGGEQVFNLRVEEPMISMMEATPDTICAGSLVSLEAIDTNAISNLISYTWSSNPLNSGVSATLAASNTEIIYQQPTATTRYSVEVTNIYGCKVKDSVLVFVNPLPGTGISPDSVIQFCPHTSAVLFATTSNVTCAGNCSYQWEAERNGSWQPIGNASFINRNFAENVRLYITANNCRDSATARLEKLPAPLVSIIGIDSVVPLCVGQPLLLQATVAAGFNYQWNTGSTQPNLLVTSQGGYYVQVTDANGCIGVSEPVLVANSPSGNNTLVSANPAAFCQIGDSAIVEAQPCLGCQYRWFQDFPTYTDEVQPLSTDRTYTASITGTFFAEVVNSSGCVYRTTNQVEITSATLASPFITATTSSLCGGTVPLIGTASATGLSYQWYYSSISAGTYSILSANTNSSMTVSLPGYYRLRTTEANGCFAESNTIHVQSATLFSPQLTPISSNVICNGGSLTISTPLFLGDTYQWYLDGVAITGATSAAYDATIAGNYYVRVTTAQGCSANTPTRTLLVSSIVQPVASADKMSFCPGDSVRLTVTLCPGCQYQWFRNGLPINAGLSSSNYLQYINSVGTYNVRVSTPLTGCEQLSNSLVITQRNAPTPSIVASITELCDGIVPYVQTSSCVGCSYTWMRADTITPTSFQPIFGAPNDTIISVGEVGYYQIRVAYPNGCTQVSSNQIIIDGGFTVALTTTVDTICNNSPVTLDAAIPVGRCAGGCTFEWFRNNSPIATNAVPTYALPLGQRQTGLYQVRVTTSNGCQSTSNLTQLTAITLAPTVSASASAICGGTPVTLTINNCPNGCTSAYDYVWSDSLSSTTSSITTNISASYIATVSLGATCSATTPPYALNPLTSLGTTIGVGGTTVASASICAGDSVVLERVSGCTACTYQWVSGTTAAFANVPTATLPIYSTNVPSFYALIANDTINNCRDTSNFVQLINVPAAVGFGLNFNNATLAASGVPADMDVLGLGLTPAALHSTGTYTSTPLFAYNPPTVNPGLTFGARRDTFAPMTAQPGNYLITYTYTQSGCTFSTSDVLRVQNSAIVEIQNLNPLHVSYEACVSDTLVIRTTNYAFGVDTVRLFNQQDVYSSVTIVSVVTTRDTLGSDTLYNQEIRIVVPDWSKGCFVRLVGRRISTAVAMSDSATTPFLLIHNEPLALSGLPATICSNGSPIVLTGTPAGGLFILQQYNSAALGTTTDTTAIAGVFTGTTLSPTAIPLAQYNVDGIDTMRVVYRFYSRFSNGNYCPEPDTVTQLVEARAVTLTQVRFNPISVSQSRERLENLVRRVFPHSAAPSRWLVGSPTNDHEIIYGGSFTTPAGAPDEFLPANAGVGPHTLTYTIRNGVCFNTVSDVIQVTPIPTPVPLADTICRNIAPVTFGRDAGYTYQANALQFIQPGVSFADTFNTLVVTSRNATTPVIPSRYITVLNSNVGLEQFRYQPQDVHPAPFTHDTLLIQYIYNRIEYNAGVPFDTVSYVMASFYQPIFIEDTALVTILDTLLSPIICENDQDVLAAATPSGGYFTLQGGTGAYAVNDTLTNNILNSFAIHQNESTATNYVLSYVYNGVACQSRDTFQFLIPEPLVPNFVTASGRRTYCNSDLPDPIIASTIGNFTNVLLVNGVAQPTMHFTPTLTTPGPQIVINQVTDADYGCITTFRDSFHVFPLPLVRIDTFAAREFCTNDSAFAFTIHPAPTCIGAVGGELLTQGFNSPVLPAGWSFQNINTASSGWGQMNLNGVGVAFVDTTSIAQNTWIYTAPINMVVGSTYQIEYLIRVGPRNCQTCADASMVVTAGTAANPGAQSIVLATFPILDDNYAGFYTMQSHSFIAPATGNFRFAFNANSSGPTTRWIAIDTIVVRAITASNCLTGIGSLSGAGVVATAGNDSLYTFVPTTLTAGNYNIRYSFSDTRGCIDSVVVPITMKPHPTVAMSALAPTYCKNEAEIPMSGTPTGGVFTINRLSGAAANNMVLWGAPPVPTNNVTYNTSVPLRFFPRNVGREGIEYRYRDPLTQCGTSVFDTVEVLAIPDSVRFLAQATTPANPAALQNIYCQTNAPVTLNVEVVRGAMAPGYFYGAGVVNGAGGTGVAQLDMNAAVAAMGRVGNDTLRYAYVAANGCIDTTFAVTRIEPIPTLSFDNVAATMRLPDSICLNDPAVGVRVRHQQFTGALGTTFIDSLIVFGAGTMTASALQIGDTINPVNFGPGWHQVSYFFRSVYGCENTIYDSFRVDTVPVVFFTGLPTTRYYCENDPGGLLMAYPAYYPGSGYLELSGGIYSPTPRRIDSSFFYIDPAQLADSTQSVTYNIYYEFTNLRGCRADGTDTIQIRPFPRITMSLDSIYCNQDDTLDLFTVVTPTGGVFVDNLPYTSILQSQYLNLNSPAGPRRITYTYTDPTTQCTNSAFQNVTLYHVPTIGFSVAGGCTGVNVGFNGTVISNLANFDSLTSTIWNFGDGNSVTLTPDPLNPLIIPSATHTYAIDGYLTPSLTVVNRGICSTTVQNNLIVSPTIALQYGTPYVQDFESGAGSWYPEQEQVANAGDTIWSHRLLTNGHIVDADNTAWVTYGNNNNVYGAGDRAHIYSPCFDFTQTWRPMISLDVWRDFNPGVDGAVLEAYEPSTDTWEVVGEINKGIRWYQSNFLLSRPGGQRAANALNPTGWSAKSTEWDNARYRLDQFAGRPSVRFRISFATAPNTVLVDLPQGFAFDSVWIGDRGRNVLIEHFTNYLTPDVYFIEQGLYDKVFNNMYGRDVTLIQYHHPLPFNLSSQNDQYYQANIIDPGARAYVYGVDTTNRALIDGQPRGDGTTLGLDINDLDYDMLQFPAFQIFMQPLIINGNTVTVNATLLAMKDMPHSNYAIITAILEDSLPNQMVDQNSYIYPLMGVMREILPDDGSRNYLGSWWQGQGYGLSETHTMTTPIPSNPALLHAAVFIQDRNTDEVFQVGTTRDLSIYMYDSLTSVQNPGEPQNINDETSSLKLFPNPASNQFTVEFQNPLTQQHQWQLVDVLGRTIQEGTAEIGSRQIQVNTQQLAAAPYFFVIRNQTVYTQRQVIITRP